MKNQGKWLGIMETKGDEFLQQSVALEKHGTETLEKSEAYAQGGIQDEDPGEPPWP
jgi:hypothetical protein